MGTEPADPVINSLMSLIQASDTAAPESFQWQTAAPEQTAASFLSHMLKTPWLNDKHTVFGHVVEGQDVVDAIAQGDVMDKVTISQKGCRCRSLQG